MCGNGKKKDDLDGYDFNLKFQRFSIQNYDLLIFFLGQLDGPKTSIRIDKVARAELNLGVWRDFYNYTVFFYWSPAAQYQNEKCL